jgi:ATP-binding cassette subfamily C (CFTR/MRP) protein 1
VLGAPVSFFDTTPLGRVMNRFSSDTDTIDQNLQDQFNAYLYAILQLLSMVLVIVLESAWVAAVMAPSFALFFLVQQFYRASSREVKRLDSTSKSPVFALFAQSLDGLATIRAYGQAQRLVHENHARLTTNMQACKSPSTPPSPLFAVFRLSGRRS